MTPFIAEIFLVSFNFAPRGYALCNGQLLSINQNQALFSLLGTTYGGNGQTTFALPDLRGRAPMHVNNSVSPNFHDLGEKSGSASHILTISEMPSHLHTAVANSNLGNTQSPVGAFLANTGNSDTDFSNQTSNTELNSNTVGATGGSQPFSLMKPYIGINYIIALQGIFPSRN